MNTYLQLGDCPELEVWATRYLAENCSFKAVDPAGRIIGLIINGVMRKSAAAEEEEEEEEDCKHAKFAIILRLMAYVEQQFDLFERHPQHERALDAKIMSVNDAYRGCGIAKELTRRTIEYMREQDLHLFHVLCSSQFSALVCERLGFEKEYELLYRDYLEDGEAPVRPAEPHVAVRVYARTV